MDKKNYTLSEVNDFVTTGEDSSNVDSDDGEEIVMLPPIERAQAETVCDSDLRRRKRRTCTPYASPSVDSPLLNKRCQTKVDESNQISDDESDEQLHKRQKQNKKKRKWQKADIDRAHDIADPNELPAELS